MLSMSLAFNNRSLALIIKELSSLIVYPTGVTTAASFTAAMLIVALLAVVNCPSETPKLNCAGPL